MNKMKKIALGVVTAMTMIEALEYPGMMGNEALCPVARRAHQNSGRLGM